MALPAPRAVPSSSKKEKPPWTIHSQNGASCLGCPPPLAKRRRRRDVDKRRELRRYDVNYVAKKSMRRNLKRRPNKMSTHFVTFYSIDVTYVDTNVDKKGR